MKMMIVGRRVRTHALNGGGVLLLHALLLGEVCIVRCGVTVSDPVR